MTMCLCLSQASIVSRRLLHYRWIVTHFGPLKPRDKQKFDLKKTRWRTADALTFPQLIYAKQLSRGHNQYSMDADGAAYCCHLANTVEPSVCGIDAALRHITLTTCYLCHYHTSCWVNAVLNGVSVTVVSVLHICCSPYCQNTCCRWCWTLFRLPQFTILCCSAVFVTLSLERFWCPWM